MRMTGALLRLDSLRSTQMTAHYGFKPWFNSDLRRRESRTG